MTDKEKTENADITEPKNGPSLSDLSVESVLEEPEEKVEQDIAVVLSSGYDRNTKKGFDLYETWKQVNQNDEVKLYNAYEKEFLNNDLCQFLILNLCAQMMDFHLEADDDATLRKVEDWMYSNDTEKHLTQFLINAFLYGTGVAERHSVNNELRNFTRVDSKTIRMTKKKTTDGRITFDYKQERAQAPDPDDPDKIHLRPLTNKHIASWRPVEVANRAHGVSMMRSSLLPLQAMRQLNIDIPAGIKKLGYSTIVFGVDLEGIDPKKHKDKIKDAVKNFAKYDSATASVVAIDKRNDLGHMGVFGGGAPMGAKVEPVLDLIEPILVFLLNKWFVPLGDVLQEKSNRALAQTQTSTARLKLNALKKSFGRFVEKELIAYILGTVDEQHNISRPPVRVVFNTSLAERKEEIELLIDLFDKGAISLQSLQRMVGIDEPEDEELIWKHKEREWVGPRDSKRQQELAEPDTANDTDTDNAVDTE